MSRAMRARPLLLMAILAGCDAPTIPERAEAYDFALQTVIGDRVLHWPVGSTIRVFIPASPDAARAAQLEQAFQRGADTWNEAALYGEYRLVRADRVENADVILTLSDTQLPISTSGCIPEVGRAVTTFCANLIPGDTISEAGLCRADLAPVLCIFPFLAPLDPGASRVRMLVTISHFETADADRFQRLVTHELGHVLGLGQHPDPANFPTSVMLSLPASAELSLADRASVQQLYHSRVEIAP